MKAVNVAVKGAVVVAALCLGACASTGGSNARLASKAGPGAIDQEKMTLVDYIARRKGVDVVWINPPQAPRND